MPCLFKHPPSAEGVFVLSDQRAVIFVNGEIANIAAAQELLCENDILIAADGGLRHLREMGLTPAWLVGDLDSVSAEDVSEQEAKGVKIYRFPVHKNETDLELAIQYAVRADINRIVVAGALGGRLDQTLGNIYLLLSDVSGDLDIRLDDGIEEVFLIRERVILQGSAGDVVSLLPFLGKAEGVTTGGLRYPLAGETLYPERTRGISNVMTGQSAEIRVERGVLLCIHTRKKYQAQTT